jgi:gamma-glutamylaminecyclotransferase
VRPLFVYGTLLRGERAHRLLRGAHFVAAVRTAPSFTLVDAGGYPGLLVVGHTAVAGEIYLAPERLLAAIDAYEEVHLGIYGRAPVTVSGRRVETYLLDRVHACRLPRLRSGDWRQRA